MKIYLLSVSIFIVIPFLKAQTGFSFTIHTVSATNSITCANPSVNMIASSSYGGPVNYTWQGPGATYYGPHANITVPGVYTVIATAGSSASSSEIVTVSSDFTFPTSTLSPFHQSITCTLSSVTNITTTANPTVNVTHKFIAPSGATYYSNGAMGLYTPGGMGTYTYVLINNTNGCSTSKTFSVLSLQGFPTFSLGSPQNFSLGCNSASIINVSILNGTSQPPGGTVSYTLLSPLISTNIPVSGTLSGISSYTLNIPGVWSVVTRDNVSFCDTRNVFTVLSNTVGPSITVVAPHQILSCHVPQVHFLAASASGNVDYDWLFPGGSIPGNTVSAAINTAIATNTLITTFTLTATDNNSTCKSSTIIPVYQNVFPPQASITNGGINRLTCHTPTIILTNQSISTIPTGVFSNALPVVATLWNGPLPQVPGAPSTTYQAYTSGIYSMQVTDQNNGCKGWDTIAIFNRKTYPLVNNPFGPPPFCINATFPSVPIYPFITASTNTYTYQWSGPPGSVITSVNTVTTTANAIGIYSIVVTDLLSSCSTLGQVIIANCYTGLLKNVPQALQISVFPNPGKGLFTISAKDLPDNLQIRICNGIGMLIKEQALLSEQSIIDLREASDGIYFLYIVEGNIPVHVSKVIKH